MQITFSTRWRLAAVSLAVALSACGGGGDDSNPLGITAVKVIGDSLSDSGTFAGLPGFGRTFTVHGSRNEPYVTWVERVAKAYDLAALCPVYKFTGTTFAPNSKTGCTNYAIGGGRINNPSSAGGAVAPLSILRQLQDAGTAGWAKGDLVAIDGGGNDAADLVTAYLGASQDKGAAYQALLATLLPPATLQTVLATAGGAETAGGLYMQALADAFSVGINAQALGKGAQHVVVANIPTITYTPRFQGVLDQIAAASGGGTNGATARAQAEGLFKAWINAFNQQLAANFAKDTRVKIIDVASRFTDMATRPASYGLTNVTLPVCGAPGVTAVPERTFADCTATALSATTPPPGAPLGATWWEGFLFADGFHPTPYGHSIMGNQVVDVLKAADWL